MKHVQTGAGAGPARLKQNLSPLALWALAFGCAVGWGAFVMPGNTFLPIAGPLGTAIGMLAGGLVMLLIGVNYHYLMNRHPNAGGTFHYAKQAFGYDHGFLSAWFLVLVYLAVLWANATAIPLLSRFLFGELFQFGFHYTVAGYDVYLGEILITLAAILLFGLLCLRGGRVTSAVMIVFALLLAIGAFVAFYLTCVYNRGGREVDFAPFFAPGNSPAAGILFITMLAPWAFVGFESISHSAEEFRGSHRSALGIMTAAVGAGALVYILLTLVAASHQPGWLSNWYAYVSNLGSLQGIQALPAFYSAQAAAGKPGLLLLGAAVLGGIITGVVGNAVAVSRLLFAMGRDGFIPSGLGKLNQYGAPRNAILFLVVISVPIPFLGRSAIGWIVDVSTVCAAVVYAYTSAVAWKEARDQGNKLMKTAGGAGVVVSLLFLLYFLVPNLWSVATLSKESYLILTVWSVLGFAVFALLFRRDASLRLGNSIVVWVILLLLLFFTSFLWVRGTTAELSADAVSSMRATYGQVLNRYGVSTSATILDNYGSFVQSYLDRVIGVVIRNTVLQFAMILVALLLVFGVYRRVQKQHITAVEEKLVAEESSAAKTTFLSNMSHDIRTPMNAIIGYLTLAKMEKDLPPRSREYLDKIQASSDHLLTLINDVLEMSRIESGRMELAPVPTDVRKMLGEVKDLFATQMETKGLDYTVTWEDVTDFQILCDRNRFDRVLLNLISNAYKFTPEGGSVTVTMIQTGREEDRASYRLSVRDTGMGMSPEFAARVFEAYERERTTAVENIQGTGLGTAITKSIVDLMGGTIEVFSEQGKGSDFVIHVSFPLDPKALEGESATERTNPEGSVFAGMRLLLVEDNPANREVEQILLEQAGFVVDAAPNGEEGVEMIAASAPGEYAAVLMDVEMPVKDGLEATRLIRSLRNPELARIPIVAITAKAFSEDIAAVLEAGMDGHIAKPINMKAVMETLSEVLLREKS